MPRYTYAEYLAVEVYTIGVEGWILHDVATDGTVELPHIGVSLPMDELYEGWEPEPPEAPSLPPFLARP